MSKSRQKNFRIEDRKYQDGYGIDRRKSSNTNKRDERRFERSIKTKNFDLNTEDGWDEFDNFDYHGYAGNRR